MTPEKDYSQRGWLAVTALIAVLIGLSFIPPQTIGRVALRRANILSDLLHFEEGAEALASQVALDEEEFHVDMDQVAEQIVADSLPPAVQTTFAWQAGRHTPHRIISPDSIRFGEEPQPGIIPIEDFDTTGESRLKALYTKLIDGKPVRIAFLGDSFIEGDILTADLRERLQDLHGGSGAGFAPMASPLTGFRRTVKTQSKGWTAYNIMQHRTTPAGLRDNYFISGWVCAPAVGAQTRWECTPARKHLDPCTRARILFVSHSRSRIEVSLNDTLHRSFEVEGNPALRQITVEGLPLHSLTFRVAEGTEGFIGYGALLESEGVGVDNYSVRSNNGQAMFRTNPSINAQANEMLGYDLVVLQYGLNIMQKGIRNYANYGEQVHKMIAYTQECFPNAAILVLGVSDRSTRTESGFEPMDAIPFMLEYQRKAAKEGGAAFWETAAAMRALGGMERFVANGWAGKDYTHINYAGGKQIAHALASALHEGARQRFHARKYEQINKALPKVMIDSQQYELIDELTKPVIIKQ